MITNEGIPKVLEFNCRFGDPETQPIMMRLKSDLVLLCLASNNNTLTECSIEWEEHVALGVVTASAGYPESASKGDVINGLDFDFPSDVKVFHAGTSKENGKIVTAGGRVLCITSLGKTVTDAKKSTYDAIKNIDYDGMFYRNDIGGRAIKRES